MAYSIQEDKGKRLIAAAVWAVIFQVLVVGLRFWSRLACARTRLWWDDWALLAALPFSLTFCSVVLSAVNIGLGRHIKDVLALGTTEQQMNKLLFIQDLIYITGIALVKLSAMLFYARVFRISKTLRTCLWIAAMVVAGLWMTFNITSTCTYIPPRKRWDFAVKGQCLNELSLFVAAASSNVIIDLILLILPLPTGLESTNQY